MECCVFIPDEPANVSSLLNQTISTDDVLKWSDPQPRSLNKSVVWGMGLLIGKVVTSFGNHCLYLCFLICVCIVAVTFPSMQPKSHQMSPHASETLCWLFRAHCKEGTYNILRTGHGGWSVGGGMLEYSSLRPCDHPLTLVLESSSWRSPLPPVLVICVCLLFRLPEAAPKT